MLDYKTGDTVLDGFELADEPAAQVYVLATEAVLRRPVERVRLLYLRSGIEARWEPEREDVEHIRDKLTELSSRIAADRTFAAAPGPHCGSCSFRRACATTVGGQHG